MQRVLLLLVVVAFTPRAAAAQGEPLGPEFRVNTYTTDNQDSPSVATDASGNFVVVWESLNQDGSDLGVFGQRYAGSGAPLGPEFRVNTYTPDWQSRPAVASDASGNFVVVWNSLYQDGSYLGVFGQRFASSGAPVGPEFRVNTFTTNNQGVPSVASDSSGNFVVVWTSGPPNYLPHDSIFGQRFAASGAPLGPEFKVNTFVFDNQSYLSVASDSSGNFVVAWESYEYPRHEWSVFGQRYASSGAPLGSQFRLNTYHAGYGEFSPSVALSSGNFVVLWSNTVAVFGQRYAGSGAPLGPEFRINTYTTDFQGSQAVASDSSGNFVVVWQSSTQDGSGNGVFGQRYASSGAPLGSEFRVNTYTTSSQNRPAVASDSSGNFVAVWDSAGNGDTGGIFGQRYNMIVPVELMHFRVE